MNKYGYKIELLSYFHYSTGLPVLLKECGEVVFSMPEDFPTAADIGENEKLSLLLPESGRYVQYFQTVAGECFIIMPLNEDAFVSAGPVLIHKPSKKFIDDIF